jgi:cytochrome P450
MRIMQLLQVVGGHWLTAATGLAAVYFTFILGNWAWKSRRPKGYPPGPPTTLLLGNILQMPATKQYIRYSELGQKYGEIVGLKFATQNVVILNSARVVHELLDKRHKIYSGRVYHGILKYVMRDGPHITISEGDYLRRWRAAARILLRPSALREILPQHAAAAAYCVEKILQAANLPEQSEAIFHALENWALTGPLNVVCGVRGAERDPTWMKWYYDFSKVNLEIMEPAAIPPLDLFPILHYLPNFLAPWKSAAYRVNDDREAICNFTLENAQNGYAKFKATANRGEQLKHEGLMARILREQSEGGSEKSPFSNEELAKIGGGLLEASIHTSLASLRAWLKILSAYPQVVARIQQELDAVCGTRDPPQESHIGSLPYLKASLQEVRFRLFREMRVRGRWMELINFRHGVGAYQRPSVYPTG